MSVVMEAESIVADGDGYISAEGSPSEEVSLSKCCRKPPKPNGKQGWHGLTTLTGMSADTVVV